MGKDAKGLFTRPASGLVREVSPTKALFYGIACTLGTYPTLFITFMVSYPIPLWNGVPIFVWALTLAALPTLAFMLCLSILTHAMPRSGGDYVYTSRILHPYLGFIEGWMLIMAVGATFGFNGWAAVWGLGAFFKVGSVVYPSWYAIGSTLHSTNAMLILGGGMFVLLAIQALSPVRRYHTVLSALVVLFLASVVIQLIPLAGISSSTFTSNFENLTGVTQQSVIDQAEGMGFNPTWMDIGGIAALLGFTIFGYTGASFSTFIAGELKGNIQRSVTISMLTTVGMCIVGAWYAAPYIALAGNVFTNGWSYLYYYGGAAPLGLPPATTLLSAIANPGLIGITLFAGFFLLVVINALALSGYAYAGVRVIFASAMDRLYPMKLAQIDEKRHQPVIATVLVLIVGLVYYVAQIVGYSPFAGLWYLTMTAIFGYLLFPVLNSMFLERRRPDIFELAPAWSKKRFLGIRVQVWLGIIWLVYLVPTFAFVNLWSPIHSMLQMESPVLLNYMFSTGLVLVGVGLIVGTVYYIIRTYYLRKQGIELSMIFRAIPPE